jgi:hypothetical protein
MMKATGLRPVMGFAVYRPDGTVQWAFEQSMRVTADQRANLLAWAFHEDIKDHSRSGHPTTPARHHRRQEGLPSRARHHQPNALRPSSKEKP